MRFLLLLSAILAVAAAASSFAPLSPDVTAFVATSATARKLYDDLGPPSDDLAPLASLAGAMRTSATVQSVVDAAHALRKRAGSHVFEQYAAAHNEAHAQRERERRTAWEAEFAAWAQRNQEVVDAHAQWEAERALFASTHHVKWLPGGVGGDKFWKDAQAETHDGRTPFRDWKAAMTNQRHHTVAALTARMWNRDGDEVDAKVVRRVDAAWLDAYTWATAKCKGMPGPEPPSSASELPEYVEEPASAYTPTAEQRAAHRARVVVVGGGPAGLLAALQAFLAGADHVTVLEQRTAYTRHNQLSNVFEVLHLLTGSLHTQLTRRPHEVALDLFREWLVEDSTSLVDAQGKVVSIAALENFLLHLLEQIEAKADAKELAVQRGRDFVGVCSFAHTGGVMHHFAIHHKAGVTPHVAHNCAEYKVEGGALVAMEGTLHAHLAAEPVDVLLGADGVKSRVRESFFDDAVFLYHRKNKDKYNCYLSMVFAYESSLGAQHIEKVRGENHYYAPETCQTHVTHEFPMPGFPGSMSKETLRLVDHVAPHTNGKTFAAAFGLFGPLYDSGEEKMLCRKNNVQHLMHWVTGVGCEHVDALQHVFDEEATGKPFLDALFPTTFNGPLGLHWKHLVSRTSRSGKTVKEAMAFKSPIVVSRETVKAPSTGEHKGLVFLLFGDAAKSSHFVSGSGVWFIAKTMGDLRESLEHIRAATRLERPASIAQPDGIAVQYVQNFDMEKAHSRVRHDVCLYATYVDQKNTMDEKTCAGTADWKRFLNRESIKLGALPAHK